MMDILMQNLESLIGSLVLAVIFFIGSHWSLMQQQKKGYRRIVSFGAGIAVAYVFIKLLPELNAASEVFVEHTHEISLPFPHLRVYAAALLGFIIYYGLQYMVNWSRLTQDEKLPEEAAEQWKFLVAISGYTLYVGIICYLMVRSLEGGPVPIVFYTVAMAFHFVSLRHSLWHEYGSMYDRWGKNILGASCLVGWAMAVFFPLPATVIITLLGYIAGAVIMNTMIAELPREKEGRFVYFFLGAVFFTGLLILI